ncbi:hypothetical protein WN51_14654 [Melipona quadrifasciata]|uniref:Uncharacterized protein n=1 Tax=Melipona quadrifasciata TaxID=166423 RepID=A0A0M8ZXW2_9HYME|nr:hypothetical protein WN51_14654 [Melipona quadrifasciata]
MVQQNLRGETLIFQIMVDLVMKTVFSDSGVSVLLYPDSHYVLSPQEKAGVIWWCGQAHERFFDDCLMALPILSPGSTSHNRRDKGNTEVWRAMSQKVWQKDSSQSRLVARNNNNSEKIESNEGSTLTKLLNPLEDRAPLLGVYRESMHAVKENADTCRMQLILWCACVLKTVV